MIENSDVCTATPGGESPCGRVSLLEGITMMRKTMLGACAGLSLSLFAGAAMAVDPPTPFDTDVNTAINRGLDYLAVTGAYDSYLGVQRRHLRQQ